MFTTREEAVGVSHDDTTASFSVGESSGRYGEGVEDDYGISVLQDKVTDVVSGVDPSKFSGDGGRLGDDLRRRGFGYGTGGLKTVNWRTTSQFAGPARIPDDEFGGGSRSPRKRPSEAHDLSKGSDQSAEAFDLSEGNGIVRSWGGRPPMKVSTVVREIDVLAEIAYIPLEGRVDSRSARQSVRALQPRQVIVLGGPKKDTTISSLADEVALLAEAAASVATSGETVHTPSDGETIVVPIGHPAYAARIVHPSDSIAESSRVCNLGHCQIRRFDTLATGQKVALDGSTVLAPVSFCESGQFVYLSDGEVFLLDLRSDLIASGMKAEYSSRAGYTQLLVNGKVVVRKYSESALIEVDGPLCQDFFSVRSLVCALFSAL
jgi:Cleavage and polyadenylation factor 2 C-terminal